MPAHMIKLTNGETILADVLDTTPEVVTVNNPIEVRLESERRTKSMMIALQWLPMLEDENIMYVNRQHIVASTPASSDIQEFYVDAIERILWPEKAEEKEREREEYVDKLLQIVKAQNANTENAVVH